MRAVLNDGIARSTPLQDDNLGVDDIAQLTADAILANRLYVLPHAASRASIRRRFERIDRTFDEQAAEGGGISFDFP